MIRWLEEPVCLSRSVLWDMQRGYYEDRGPEAWASAIVPAQATTSCVIAEAYAATVLTWAEALDVDDGQPVYVLELGAGAGRLGARLAQAIQRQRLSTSPEVIVVVSDLSSKNLAFCRSHPAMQPLITAGVVDFARLDLEQGDRPMLEIAGGPLPSTGPLCVLANYIVDSVRQDAFRFAGGQGHELLVRAGLPERKGLESVALDLQPVPLAPDHYGDAILDDLLRIYAEEIEDGDVFIPVGFLRTLRSLMSGREALFLCADKSVRYVHEWEDQLTAVIAHGSVSVTANMHAIAHQFQALGGGVWHSDSADTTFTLSACLLDPRPVVHEKVGRAFDRWLNDAGPADFERLGDHLPPEEHLSLALMLTILRMSQYDAATFVGFAETLPELVDEADEVERQDLARVLARVWDRHYRVDESDVLAFHLGRTYMELGDFDLALRFFETSLVQDGADLAVHYNLALCLERLDRDAEAKQHLELALGLDPDDADVAERLRELEIKAAEAG